MGDLRGRALDAQRPARGVAAGGETPLFADCLLGRRHGNLRDSLARAAALLVLATLPILLVKEDSE